MRNKRITAEISTGPPAEGIGEVPTGGEELE